MKVLLRVCVVCEELLEPVDFCLRVGDKIKISHGCCGRKKCLEAWK